MNLQSSEFGLIFDCTMARIETVLIWDLVFEKSYDSGELLQRLADLRKAKVSEKKRQVDLQSVEAWLIV